MIIEPGKFYLQVVDGYVQDAVSYNPELEGYNLFEIEQLPQDILNRCYQIIDGALVLDEEKHAEFLIEMERLREEYEAERQKMLEEQE